MAKKKKNGASSNKFRIEFKRNRNERTRENDWTRKFRPEDLDNDGNENDEPDSAERISGKGDLVRKRTVVGTKLNVENNSGDRGDFAILPEIHSESCRTGRVLKVHGLNSYVEDENGKIFTCVTRRILKTISTAQRQIVVAGDRVQFRDALNPELNEGIIERVEPRTSSLSRTSWSRKHIIVTNVDQALIIASAAEPRLKPNLIDRFLLTCVRSGIEPVICINKIDLVDRSYYQSLIGVYSQMGFKVILLSAFTGFGIDRLRRLLTDRESVLVGQSGVGKSSILNAIEPGLNLRVGAVSQENEKGRHTTTTAELLRLNFGGYVVDTPGIRQFMLWDIIPEEVAGFYPDLYPFENLCRYPDCTHTHEDNCAVKLAVEDGRLNARRYRSYLALRAGEMEKQDKAEKKKPEN